MKIIGEKVRQIRLIKGYSQENLSKVIGKSQNWVSKFENGNKKIDAGTFIKMCEFLQIDKLDLESNIENLVFKDSEEEVILTFIKSFNIISKELDRLIKLKNHIKDKLNF